MASSGDVSTGGNGSVHWQVRHKARTQRKGAQPLPANCFKKLCVNRHYFTLTLRYPDKETALAALADAGKAIKNTRKGVATTLQVNMIPRDKPKENLPWEVKVAW